MKMNQMNSLILNSPWPIMLSINLMMNLLNMTMMMNKSITKTMLLIIPTLILTTMWLNNSLKEKFMTGMMKNYTEMSMKPLILTIMMTESMFFLTFFYINFSLMFFNNTMFNMKFYLNMFKLNFMLSLTNLMILLLSSMTLMISMKPSNTKTYKSIMYLMITAILGSYFILIQITEYSMLNFNLSNSIFFSNFFTLTMFHMTHVMMGMLMILYMTKMKMKYLMLNKTKMKMMCWYWHFVDTIWIFIFLLMYT